MSLALLAALLLVFAGMRAEAKSGNRALLPNVILISVDTLRQASLRAFAAEAGELPHIDAFSRRARAFENAYAPASWTLPSTASLMTGLYPDRHGATDRRLKLAPGLDTLAGRLRGAGYETVGYTDGAFVDRSYGLGKGFDRYDRATSAKARRAQPVRVPRGGRPHPVAGSALFDRAIAFLGQHSQRPFQAKPLFMFLHTYSVHEYWRVRPWAAQAASEFELRDADYYALCLQGTRSCPDADWRALEALYEAEVRHFDEGFGRLLTALADADLGENTLIVFVSDHGEGFEPGRVHHGGHLHNDQLRVPLLVAGPGVAPGTTSTPVSLVDVMPTLLGWLGLDAPADLDGSSFAPGLRGLDLPGARPALAMEHAFRWEDGRRTEIGEASAAALALAVIDDDSWYIRHELTEELYDTHSDSQQIRNLAPGSSRLAASRRVADARSAQRRPLILADANPLIAQQLRTLGYLE